MTGGAFQLEHEELQQWPATLMRGVKNISSKEHWQFLWQSDHNQETVLSSPVDRLLPAGYALTLTMRELLQHFTQCPRCHDWVLRHNEWNRLHRLCTVCVTHIKQGVPLKNLGEDPAPALQAELFYSAFLGERYREPLRQLPFETVFQAPAKPSFAQPVVVLKSRKKRGSSVSPVNASR
jgi:ribosomal protein L32